MFGGVKKDWEKGVYWTEFYVGDDIHTLEYLARGPENMKDIRLVQLPDGRIGVFTRPQGEVGGLGKIGFTIVEELSRLNADVIGQAGLIEDQFGEKRWGGVNQALLLANGRIGVLGHVAEFEVDGTKRYSAMTFVFDPDLRKSTPMQVIAVREDFPMTAAKRPDLKHVVLPAGIVLNGDQTAQLFVGLSDIGVGVKPVFRKF